MTFHSVSKYRFAIQKCFNRISKLVAFFFIAFHIDIYKFNGVTEFVEINNVISCTYRSRIDRSYDSYFCTNNRAIILVYLVTEKETIIQFFCC